MWPSMMALKARCVADLDGGARRSCRRELVTDTLVDEHVASTLMPIGEREPRDAGQRHRRAEATRGSRAAGTGS